MRIVQKITPNLWFDTNADAAVTFYTCVFRNSRIGRTAYYSKEGQEIHKMPEGSVMTVEFEIEGMKFVALNGGPVFKFTEAVSFIIYCEDQDEIDYYWNHLKEGGDERAQVCGWLKDKFGVSWQVVPAELDDMMVDPDPVKRSRAMAAMLQMKKLDIKQLRDAFNGKS